MLADFCFQRGPLFPGKVLHKWHHRCHGICPQHCACRRQRGCLCNGHARVQRQDGSGIVAPQLAQPPANAVHPLPLGRLQVGEQIVDVIHGLPAPVLFDDLVFQDANALGRLHPAVQDFLHVPDRRCQTRVGRRIPQRALHHIVALFQQDGLAALHTVFQEAAPLDGGIQLQALDLGCQLGLVHRNGVIVLHGGPLVAQQLHAGLVDEIGGVPPKEVFHVLAPCPVVIGHSLFDGLHNGVRHRGAVGVQQAAQLHSLTFLVGCLNVSLVVGFRVRQGQAACQQVVPAVRIFQVHVQAAQLGVGQGHRVALGVFQSHVYQLRAWARKLLHVLHVGFARHVVKQGRSLHRDLGLLPLALVQDVRQLLHLAVLGIAAQHPEHPLGSQHVQVIQRQRFLQAGASRLVALGCQHLVGRSLGKGIHFLGLFQAQGLVGRPDHMQRAGRDGFQHPHLVHGHGQVYPVFRLVDPLLQTVLQGPGLFAVWQGPGLGHLFVQTVQLCLLGRRQVHFQCVDQLHHTALLPVHAHAAGAALGALCHLDAGAQGFQPLHGLNVHHSQVGQLCHLCCLHDEALLHILSRCRPQHHLVQLGRVPLDAPPELVFLASLPGFLHPLFRQCLGHGNVLIPLLPCHLNGNCILLGLLLLPGFCLALVLLLPFQDVVFLENELPLGPVCPALFPCHLPGQLRVLRFQLSALQGNVVQHLPPFLPHPLLFGFPFPVVGLPQHFQLFVQVPDVRDVHTQHVQVLVQQPLGCPVLLFLPGKGLCFVALGSSLAVLVQPPVKLPGLLSLDPFQALEHFGCSLLTACGRGSHFPVVFLDAIEDGLHVGHLIQVHHLAQHPACQLHLGVLILGHVGKAAHHPGLDGIMHVHQHFQPLGAFHAGSPCHTRVLGCRAEQSCCTVFHTAHAPGVVHDALILFHRVAIPVSGLPPQLHAMASGVFHRRAPGSVPPGKLCLRLSALGHGIAQVMQFRVLVPQLCVAVGRMVQHLSCQHFGHALGLLHVGPVGFQVLHQRPQLLGKLAGMQFAFGPAALDDPQRHPLQAVVRDPHTPGDSKEIHQSLEGGVPLCNSPAGLSLGVLPGVPVGALCHLEPDVRHLVQQLCPLGLVSGLVLLHGNAVLFQAVHQRRAGIVRQDRGFHFFKAHSPLGLCLKVSGGDGSHVLVQLPDQRRRILADAVALLGKRLANGCGRLAALRGPQQDVAQDFPFFKAVARVGLRLAAQLAEDGLDLAVCLFQQGFILLLRHLLQASFVCPHFVQVLILRRGRAHQGIGRESPRAFSPGFLLVHGCHKVFQGVGVVQLGKTAAVALLGVGVLSVVDTLFSQNLLHFGQQPGGHIGVRCLFPQLLLHGVSILHQLARNVFGRYILVCVFQPGPQHGRDQPCRFGLCLFLAPSQLFHGPGRFCLPPLIQHRVGSVVVSAHHVRLHDVPQHALPANSLHDLLIALLLALSKPHLRLCHHLDVLALVGQIRRLNGIVLGQAFRQLLRALAGGLHVQRAGQHTAPGKGPLGSLAAQLCQLRIQLHGLVRIHLILHIRSCRRPGI